MNNRQLTYIEDKFFTLTPNALIFGIQNHIPTMQNKHDIIGKEL